jgi:hypothetical protein
MLASLTERCRASVIVRSVTDCNGSLGLAWLRCAALRCAALGPQLLVTLRTIEDPTHTDCESVLSIGQCAWYAPVTETVVYAMGSTQESRYSHPQKFLSHSD